MKLSNLDLINDLVKQRRALSPARQLIATGSDLSLTVSHDGDEFFVELKDLSVKEANALRDILTSRLALAEQTMAEFGVEVDADAD